MATPSYVRSLVSLTKRLKLSPLPVVGNARYLHQTTRRADVQTLSKTTTETAASLPPVDSLSPEELDKELLNIRLPRAIQSVYLTPLRRQATYGDHVCDLQIRSYSVRNLEVFTDFALRAAYYLNLPVKGPLPLPRITERWTVPRSNFIFKKSQENFERRTTRRLIRIYDGNSETVSLWLAFLQKHRYYGIGMKANVFEHSSLDAVDNLDIDVTKGAEQPEGPDVEVADMFQNNFLESEEFKNLDSEAKKRFQQSAEQASKAQASKSELQKALEDQVALLRRVPKSGPAGDSDRADTSEMLQAEQYKGAWGGYTAPMTRAQSTPAAMRRFQRRQRRTPAKKSGDGAK